MRDSFLLIFIPFLLNGCAKPKTSSISDSELVIHRYDYIDIEDKKMSWESLFSIRDDRYSVYIYSQRCGHCNEIKQTVIEYSFKNDSFYFVEYTSEIPILDNVNETIGKNNSEDIGILGTPTLLVIESGILVENIAGSKAIIETLEK